jgi:segregation and condensation protein A
MDESQSDIRKTQFKIQTDIYSGPLDLLIDLIEKRKLLVNDISLASVTDEYMQYVARMEQESLHDVADFIVLASTLLLLKSRSLLPVLELSESEEETVENLEERLKIYQIYRNAGKGIESIFGINESNERPFKIDTEPLFIPDSYTTQSSLRDAIYSVLQNLPKKVEKPNVKVKKVISLEEVIDNLKNRIERQLSFTFSEFTGSTADRPAVIVGFLAVLEMVKQESILVTQSIRFSEIEIERRTSTPPRYY